MSGNWGKPMAFALMVSWFAICGHGVPPVHGLAAPVAGLALKASGGSHEGSRQESLEFPMLPGVPGGHSVPLPPRLKKESSVRPAGPEQMTNNLVGGTGRYAGMVLIPAGAFLMGSTDAEGRPDERPSHSVFLRPFYVAKHEVTVREYCDFLNAQGDKSRNGLPRVRLDSLHCPIQRDGSHFQPKSGMAEKPMAGVSWYGATEYADWMGGRLPTSAEWEKAALLSTPYQPGDYLTILSREDSVPVSIAAPGLCGITGMSGNVWEWCSDWYAEDYYEKSAINNPPGPPPGKEKVIRGGSWASPEASKRIRNIHRADPNGYFKTVGFRIVKD